EALAAGRAVAPPRFQPQPPADRSQLAADWRDQGGSLAAAIAGWSESEADAHVLPHPVLGNLTIREMLRFAAYHNQHHVNDVRRLLGRDEIEWFAGDDAGR
ncbi:MAG TPA: DinB family protein, partial [Herpetosiphonaceae bacterium]